jgi:tRNA (adenine22-N1)-methyltransferase
MGLEDRLLCVATEVASGCHADIGTDHALLPLYLLNNGLCEKVVVSEMSPNAYLVARQALWGRPAQVFQGDGLEPFEGIQMDSLSLCGLGGSKIREILRAYPERVPDRVIVQANRDSHKVRRWGTEAGFHLIREQLAQGHWLYEILTFHRGTGPDPAYQDLEEELGFYFGPHFLGSANPILKEELHRRKSLQKKHPRNRQLQRIERALELLS